MFDNSLTKEQLVKIKENNIFLDLYTYGEITLVNLKNKIINMIDDVTDLDREVEDLKIEFNKLFALFLDEEEAIPLFASYYLNNQTLIFTEETIKVKEFYKDNEYRIVGEEFVPEDSLVLEFGFVANLINDMLLDSNTESDNNKSLQVQEMFISKHLLNWIKLMLKTKGFNKKKSFYRYLLEFAILFTIKDQEELAKIIERKKE
ncbi:molecular chaperone TorD family protein [Lagierella sp.]|uniref:TorD/DmsD family molecular chaperone n=1 Tax=Lagierella sp. TaxID=2849657 RepID=UPI002619BE75|nr:molecular chaperone TorD family protein [Lagierella sp.]